MKKQIALQLLIVLTLSFSALGATHEFNFNLDPSMERITLEEAYIDMSSLEILYRDVYFDVISFSIPITSTISGGDSVSLTLNLADDQRIQIAENNRYFEVSMNCSSGQSLDSATSLTLNSDGAYNISLLNSQNFLSEQTTSQLLPKYLKDTGDYSIQISWGLFQDEHEIYEDISNPNPTIVPPDYNDNANFGGIDIDLQFPTFIDYMGIGSPEETVLIEPKEYLMTEISLWASVETIDAPSAFEVVPEPATLSLLALGGLLLRRRKKA
jgi:hypothetical protein